MVNTELKKNAHAVSLLSVTFGIINPTSQIKPLLYTKYHNTIKDIIHTQNILHLY